MPAADTAAAPPSAPSKPRDDEIDVHGLTHPGKVRSDNQDHFLICALSKQIVVRLTSLPVPDNLMAGAERLAFLAMVADGVGGGNKGATASQVALEAVTQYVTNSMNSYYAATSADDQEFYDALKAGAARSHAELLRQGQENPDYRGRATTLTLYLGVWPRAYLLQVGDSRAYVLSNGELNQITRDQTMAQELVDAGVMPAEVAAGTRLAHTLSSSIGGRQTDPQVHRLDVTWGNVLLLCSDGLTRHVSDDQIREVLRTMQSAEQACERLLQLALDDGGSDNITIVIARAIKREQT